MTKVKHKPRGDYVLVERITFGKTPSGIGVPDTSQEGFEHRVVATGPQVEGVEVGDKVLVIGVLGIDYQFLPNSKVVFFTKEKNLVMVYDEDV